MTHRKKLIEVALPLEAINKAAAREKGNPFIKGHPRNMHQWWARRPLTTCRAVIFSSLVDDPSSDPAYRRPDGSVDEDAAGMKRAQLFNLIEELVQWENSNNETVINAARAEIARCVANRKLETGDLKKTDKLAGGETVWDLVVKGHGDLDAIRSGRWRLPRPEAVNAFLAEHAPPVLDPFCGGGSIPLEAQRLGLRTYASDLNPVAVLTTKAQIEIPPKFAGRPPVNPESRGQASGNRGQSRLMQKQWTGAKGLAEDVRYYGKWMRDEAEKRIGHLYPKVKITKVMAKGRPDLEPYVGQELTVIAWLWARTCPSPDPALSGAHVPLVRSFVLSNKKGKEIWIKPIVDRPRAEYRFEVRIGPPPDGELAIRGTMTAGGATCLLSGSPLPFDYIRKKGQTDELSARLLAIYVRAGSQRIFVSPCEAHETIATEVETAGAPDTAIPEAALGFRVQLYGLDEHRKLFTKRQLTALSTFVGLLSSLRQTLVADNGCNDPEYANALVTYIALAVSQLSRYSSTLCKWNATNQNIGQVFGMQTLSMTWDYPETNILDSIVDITVAAEWIAAVLDELPTGALANVVQRDAREPFLVDTAVIATDPPYYDNVGYADLSDYFYVWLRKGLADVFPSLFSTVLTPKEGELIAAPHRFDGDAATARDFFEHGLRDSFCRMRQSAAPDWPLTVFYAFKQSEGNESDEEATHQGLASTGWETMLEGLLAAGFQIVGTWPMRTERPGRLRETGSNALASSILLACRPRLSIATITTRKDFLVAMKRELPGSLRNLQLSNIAPVDLAQAAIGPGMAVFSRYSKVLETDGSPMRVRTALALINQALDEVLTEQEAEFDVDTRWALAWFEQHAHDEGLYGDAETLSKAKNVSVRGLEEAGFLSARGGKVRLLRREELDADWEPATDARMTIWEVTQHLIRRLDQAGESGAADLLRKLGGVGEVARDLAYRLYTTCERKKWAQEALAYNSLVVAWPEVSRLSRHAAQTQSQANLFER